ncbi:MAG: HAMP domain-containing protein [Bacteroidales bacterium]|nr:HAMP domain-containing protein [Bacteroidales bacterium]
MTTLKNKYGKVPHYHGLRVYLVSTILYFFLVFPVAGILAVKYVPDYMSRTKNNQAVSAISKASEGFSQLNEIDSVSNQIRNVQSSTDSSSFSIKISTPDSPKFGMTLGDKTQENSQIGGTMALLIRLLMVSFLIGLGFNLPFLIYFKKKRRRMPIKARIQQYCRKFVLKSPLINTGILTLPYSITLLYMLYIILFKKGVDDLNWQFYLQYFFITLVASILTLMLVYFWMKHRVHIRYLEHIYSEEELKKRIFKVRQEKIRNRLWISSAMTTLFPLIIVVFYIVLSMSSVRELEINKFTDEHQKILLGKYVALNLGLDLPTIDKFFYVNAVNSLLMVLGIGTGIFIALIYIVLFVRWTTEDIVRPVNELLANMQRTGRGELDSFSIVRTNDEIGALTEGYNEMSGKLKSYFQSLDNINRANARFVPRQFLDFLGKESITDIQLGDQVQKEMTILFSDIRDFTAMSETMTPKENFDFINNYLGYMEPVIRHNNGFIDKFMGDSIMALFPERSEDAINASIEMRIKLMEYNEIIGQFGKPTIDAGVGIHTGLLMLGIIGGEGRMDGTVISDAVNLAARLEGLTKVYGGSIIITEDTLIKLNDPSQYQFRFLDVVKVKGKKEAIYIFEIMDGEPENIKNLKLSTKEDYNKALQAYKKKEFKSALKLLQSIEAVNPKDKTIKIYLERCSHYIEKGVPEFWDGVESFDLKY